MRWRRVLGELGSGRMGHRVLEGGAGKESEEVLEKTTAEESSSLRGGLHRDLEDLRNKKMEKTVMMATVAVNNTTS